MAPSKASQKKPARVIRPSRVANTGYVAGTDGMEAVESYLETAFLYLLRFDPNVVRFRTQSIKIRWVDGKGKDREYTPDIEVHYKNRPSELIEVKHSALLERDRAVLEEKFEQAEAWTQERDWGFRVVLEDQIPEILVANLRFLDRYRKPGFHLPAEVLPKLLAAFPDGDTTPNALLDSLASTATEKAEYLPGLWLLVATGKVGCDFNVKITMTTPIWLQHGGAEIWQQ